MPPGSPAPSRSLTPLCWGVLLWLLGSPRDVWQGSGSHWYTTFQLDSLALARSPGRRRSALRLVLRSMRDVIK